MKNLLNKFLDNSLLKFILVLLLIQTNLIFAQDWDLPESRGLKDTLANGFVAGVETLVPSSIFMLINGFVYGTSWGRPTAESIRRNLSVSWKWEDTDDFAVNQIGHPYHGSFYFNSGRLHGFGFYESVFFTAFGGFMWEVFGEANHPSINDMLTTTISSMATGEMLYRLYAEAYAAGVPEPLAFFISPVASIHRLFGRRKPPRVGGNLYYFQAYLGGGYADTHYSVSDLESEVFYFSGPFANVGFKIAYGNPFEQDTSIPYRHFEMDAFFGMNPDRYSDLRVISDGYLFSFSPLYTDTDTMSTGLSLHFDYVSQGKPGLEDSTVDQFSNALDWTFKYQHLFSPETAFQQKLHMGFTFFGASEYFAGKPVLNDFAHEKTDYNNFGAGFNSKWFSVLEYKWGRLETGLLCYILFTYPGTTHFSQGTVYWLFTNVSYSHFITNHISLGATYYHAMEQGSFNDGYADTWKSNRVVNIFIAWNL